MQKKSLLLILVLGIFLINFVSAQFYGSFSITDLLYSIDPTVMTLAVLFIIIFAFSFFSLSRIFKSKYGEPNKAMAGVVALALSTLAVYWINRSDLDFESFFYDIGISSEILYIVLPIIILVGIIWLSRKIRFYNVLLILGALFIVVTFTNLIYEKGAAFVIGVVLIVIGLLLRRWKKGKGGGKSRPWTFSGPRQEWVTKEKAQPRLEEELAAIRRRQRLADERARLRKGRREERIDEKERLKQKKQAEKDELARQREEIEAKRLEELKQREAERMQQRQQEEKYQKMTRHLQMLAAQKERELQKQQMMAAKGVRGAEQRVRTLQAELQEIARKRQKYS